VTRSTWAPSPLSAADADARVRYAHVALLAAEGHVGRAAAALRAAGVLDAPTDEAARRALDRIISERDGMRQWLSDTFVQPGRLGSKPRQPG
jgi:hypothetical protein